MVTDKYIQENQTSTLKKGDIVIMHNCHEAKFHENKKDWICQTDSFKDKAGQNAVFLEGYSGYFLTQFLKQTPPK